jgi:CRP-like cAMP-binding protein
MPMVLLDELQDLAFLEGFAPEHLRQIARAAQLKEYLPGVVLFCEGRASPYVYLLLQGEVRLDIAVPGQGALPIQTLSSGELVGWSPVLRTGPMTATAHTVTRCRLAALDAAQVLAMSDQDPRFGMEFLRRTAVALAQRLRATRQKVVASPQA